MSALDELLIKRYQETVAATEEAGEKLAEKAADTTAALTDAVSDVASPVKTQTAVDDSVESIAEAPTELGAVDVTAVEPDGTSASDHSDEQAEPEPVPEPVEHLGTGEVKANREFRPDWEVDRFLWPVICEDVEVRLEAELSRAMATIVGDCEQHESNVVAITRVGSGEGATTMTLCLAREAARQGLTVAMIDLDHVAPSLMDRLGVACEQGIESLHKSSVGTENVCVTAVDDGVSLLPTMESLDVEYCASETIQQLIDEVAEHHDLVLIDASPEVIDQFAKSESTKKIGAIFVANEASSVAIDKAVEIADGEVRTLGLIENFAA